jgi:hypothetical protein
MITLLLAYVMIPTPVRLLADGEAPEAPQAPEAPGAPVEAPLRAG